MAIGGEKRDPSVGGVKRVGLFEAKVIAVNPTAEKYKEVTGFDLKADSKVTEYMGKTEKGNEYIRLDFWLEEVKNGYKFKVSFFLENRERENKDLTKKQFINNVGFCSWADDPINLPKWFIGEEEAREYRVAHVGEEELMTFVQVWLGKLDIRNKRTVLEFDFKKLIKGYIGEITNEIEGEWCNNVVCLATISVKDKDGELKEHQNVYNKAFMNPFSLSNFRLIDYMDTKVLGDLRAKKTRDLKSHEKFVLNVTGEYGCKDFFLLKDLQDYSSDMNLTATDKDHEPDDSDY